ncbi:MAG: NADP-dependent 3-hydroxy acid dehydrogenase YdfG [Chlamydiae bacterium]|nr:NADP-dependent 3-hydroxy acid dehydrogenase YdfG [Chlamydiota bacterium]
MKTVFITGASSGIGWATAIKCAQEKNRVLICARRSDRLKKLSEELKQKYQADVHYFSLDVSKKSEVEEKIKNLPENWQEIDVLVNNAGLALGLESIDKGAADDWETMIDVNVKGLLYVTQAVVKGMLERKKGQIINIGSISGRETYPGGSVYCATKHAVRALTEGMKKDWHGTPIRISEVNPGFAQTEFSLVRFKQDEKRADSVYQNTKPLLAEDIADAIYYCLSRPEHIDIREVFITSTAQSSTTMIDRSN